MKMKFLTKICRNCGIAKTLDEFYKHPAMPDGYLNQCKQCKISYAHVYRNMHIDAIRAYDRYRGALPHRKEKRYQYAITHKDKIRGIQSKWARENKHKKQAHWKVARLIQSGKILRQPCEVCGNVNSQAHHEDYTQPQDIMWLCPRHHAIRHKEKRTLGI